MQIVPSLVSFVNHLLQATGRIGAVLSGKAAVLLVDEFQLGQALVHLSLESLGPQRSTSEGGQRRALGKGARVSYRGVRENGKSHCHVQGKDSF